MKNSSKVESNDHARKNLSLILKFKTLEQQWKSLQHPKPRTSDHSTTTTSFDQLFDNSPSDLMISLQKSPSDRIFKAKPLNMAVLEILRDRRAAIVSGKLKGRRLFTAAAEESHINYDSGEVCSDWLNDAVEERDVKMPADFDQSCSFSDSSPSEEQVVAVEVAEKRGRDRRGGGGRVVPLAWFVVVLMVVTLGLGFVSMSCNGKCVEKCELILVPT